MKKYAVILLVGLFIAGCMSSPEGGKPLARINNYEISEAEFEEEFKASSYSHSDTVESRGEFLNTLINRKLILQDAQKKGMDKNESFLKMIERFWEQSLLKIALDRKSNEIAGSAFVGDKEVKEAYEIMFKEGKTDKPYDQMYQPIKWQITKQKENQTMSDWLSSLRK
ncbi:MAG: hypothetical protein WC335_09815, partial [Candidatus Omnitrophota bacterium]